MFELNIFGLMFLQKGKKEKQINCTTLIKTILFETKSSDFMLILSLEKLRNEEKFWNEGIISH